MSSTRRGKSEDDFYGVLGLSQDATPSEVKKAYKKLALRHHPDKNPENPTAAEAAFKLVTRAYEVLSNPELRARYDRYGVAGLESSAPPSSTHRSTRSAAGAPDFPDGFGANPFRGGNGFAFHDPFEIFRSVFGGVDPFADMRGGGGGGPQRHQQPGYGTRGHPADPFQAMMGGGMFGMGPMGMGGGTFGMGPMGMGGGTFGMGPMGMGGGMFGDDFFGGSMMHPMGRGGGGVSTSRSVTTVIQNGRRVTRTVTRKTDANGVVTEDVDEEIEDIGGGRSRGGHQQIPSGGARSIQFMF